MSSAVPRQWGKNDVGVDVNRCVLVKGKPMWKQCPLFLLLLESPHVHHTSKTLGSTAVNSVSNKTTWLYLFN